MKNANPMRSMIGVWALLVGATAVSAQDWPQWRGQNRDAKATGFDAPKTWPKELTQKWKVTVGEGVATPSLVGDKLYVFSRQAGMEVTRCLDAATGKELWQDKYEAQGATGPASGFSGPRCSPTVVDGKVVTLGVRGTLSCFDAATGKNLWRKDDFQGYWPQFFAASSPLVVDGLCIAQLGGKENGRGKDNGAVVAYDLATGNEKWKWTGDGPAYASPVLLTVSGTKLIVAQTANKMVALGAADGKQAWEAPFAAPRMVYNAATPIVDGQTIIYGGNDRGAKAVKIEKAGDGFAAKDLWSNAEKEKSVKFNTPVLKDGFLYGVTQANELFCMNAESGKITWSVPAGPAGGSGRAAGGVQPGGAGQPGAGGQPPRGGQPGAGGQPPAGGRGGRGGRMGGGGGGYGSIVDAGSVLIALTPGSQLIVFQPNNKAYTELARIKVANTPTHAYPVIAGNRVFIKDQDSVALLAIQ
jgi:outer membrane protein assembly factor BamB